LTRPTRQHIVEIGAARSVARIQARIAEAYRPCAEHRIEIRLNAANARAVEIVRRKDARVVDDQIVHVALVSGEREAERRARPTDAHFIARRTLGIEIRVAESREIEVVERGCAERGAPKSAQGPAVIQHPFPTEAAGFVAAELFVVVVAGGGEQAMRAEERLVLRERTDVVA